MATRFKNDEHMRAHIERAMQKLSTSLRYSTPSVQRILQEEGYIAGLDRVFRIIHEIQHEEADNEE